MIKIYGKNPHFTIKLYSDNEILAGHWQKCQKKSKVRNQFAKIKVYIMQN